jgi:hypothetical protein
LGIEYKGSAGRVLFNEFNEGFFGGSFQKQTPIMFCGQYCANANHNVIKVSEESASSLNNLS